MALLPVAESRLGLFGIAYVEGQQLTITVHHLQCFLSLSLIAGIIDDDLIALLGQFHADGSSDATAATCY